MRRFLFSLLASCALVSGAAFIGQPASAGEFCVRAPGQSCDEEPGFSTPGSANPFFNSPGSSNQRTPNIIIPESEYRSRDTAEYYKVYIENNTDHTIWVAVHAYVDQYCFDATCYGDAEWETISYYRMSPGQKKQILNGNYGQTRNRHIYFHAYDSHGRVWGGNYSFDTSSGERAFFRSDMGSRVGTFTQKFTLR